MAASGKKVDITGAMVTEPVAASDWLVIASVAICIMAGALVLMFRKETGRHVSIAIIALGLAVAANFGLLIKVVAEGPLVMTMGRWLPPFGITFNADIFGTVFALTASIVAFAGAIFARGDIDDTGRRYGFYPFLLLMMAGVNGAFLTGDIFNLYVWFEVLLISSFGMLILGSEKQQIDGATKYALLNLVATTLFLIATGYLYGTVGSLNMADITAKLPEVRNTAPLMTLCALFFLAFAMKAAAFPLNFWLPASYHTPKIVTSALFAGLLTKVGIYALGRILITLMPAERDLLAETIAWVAAATMILGIMGALAQSDIRRLMGYVVISGIGTMMAGLALASPTAISGTVFYAVHSMIAMTALYLLAGMMRERGGTFSLREAGGLYRAHPLLAAFALVLFLAVAGLPPFSGLWPKILLVKASFDVGAWWLGGAILVTGLLTTIALGRVFALAFWRNSDGRMESSNAPSNRSSILISYLPIALLTVPIVIMGIYPEPFLQLADQAATAVANSTGYREAVFTTGGTQ